MVITPMQDEQVWLVLWFLCVQTESHSRCSTLHLTALQTFIVADYISYSQWPGISCTGQEQKQLRLFAAYAFVEYIANLLQFVAIVWITGVLDFIYDKRSWAGMRWRWKLSQFFWQKIQPGISILSPGYIQPVTGF